MFYKEVDKRYKIPMIDFLQKHFRYDHEQLEQIDQLCQQYQAA